MRTRISAICFLFGLTQSACSVTNAYVFPRQVQENYIITAGDLDCPYESLGYAQISRSGTDLFGFVSVVDADLQKMFGSLLIDDLERHQADGIINMQFWERQYTTAARVFFVFPLFFFPLPTYVEVTGEYIRIPPAARAACRAAAQALPPSVVSPPPPSPAAAPTDPSLVPGGGLDT